MNYVFYCKERLKFYVEILTPIAWTKIEDLMFMVFLKQYINVYL